MGAYDTIGIPVGGQKVSTAQFGIKVRDAIIDLDARMALRESAELLPAPVSATGGTPNSVTAATNVWQTLSPNGASVVMTNPSATFDLVCLVFFGGWMAIASGGTRDVRMGLNITGGVTSDPDPGPNSPVGYGLLPLTSNIDAQQGMGMFQLEIPAGAGAVTLTAQGRRSNSANAATINYPAINVIPIRYDVP
jgi:hypothetical protein